MRQSDEKKTDPSVDLKTSFQNEQGHPTQQDVEEAVRVLIRWAGDNPDREGLRETPLRVAKAFSEYCSGYTEQPEIVLDKFFVDVSGYHDMVLVRDIPFYSHCEHHLAPFFGHAHVAYYPSRGVVGLSKLARLVDLFAKRLQTQENLTAQIADTLDRVIEARGVAVLTQAEHLCMAMRGVKKPGTLTLTSHFTGSFKQDPALQARFFSMLQHKV